MPRKYKIMSRARWYIAVIFIVAVVAAYVPVRNLTFALRMMSAMRSLASGSTAQELPVLVEKSFHRRGDQDLESIVYRPARRHPERALVLVPGISELGCYHPRLVALSRAVADQGFIVVTPDIRMFRQFRIGPEAMDEIAFWFDQAWSLTPGGDDRKVGLAGISFSGTLALITAARPEIRTRVAWVLGIGAYDDPLRCSREWFAAGPVTVGPGYYPTRYYARWIIMLAALDLLPSEAERRFLQTVLVDLLLQRAVTPPPFQLPPDAERWQRTALMREDQEDPVLARQIEDYLMPRLYANITPDEAAAAVRCPVFLVHGAQDDLIPPEESRRLQQRLGTRARLLISPFLTHTHPNEKPLGWREKTKAAMDMLEFFYNFAAVSR